MCHVCICALGVKIFVWRISPFFDNVRLCTGPNIQYYTYICTHIFGRFVFVLEQTQRTRHTAE